MSGAVPITDGCGALVGRVVWVRADPLRPGHVELGGGFGGREFFVVRLTADERAGLIARLQELS